MGEDRVCIGRAFMEAFQLQSGCVDEAHDADRYSPVYSISTTTW